MSIVFGLAGVVLFSIAAYKIATAQRMPKPVKAPEIWGLVGEATATEGPITIKRILGPRGDGEPIVANRVPGEDGSMPWVVHRNEESAQPFFEWQWRERTEDNPGDAYYSPIGGAFYNAGRGLATIKNVLSPARWWQFKKLSEHTDDNNGVYNRR